MVARTHLNFVHDNGVWTTRASEKADMRDALIVDTEKHFLVAPSQLEQVPKMEIYDGFNDPDTTSSCFLTRPTVLNHPVRDVKARCAEVGVVTIGAPCPLQHLLAELCSLPTIQYRIHLVTWLKSNSHKLKLAHDWCCAHGFDLEEYCEHLGRGRPADGLEVLLMSLAINTHINIVFEDSVWATGVEGINLSFPMIVFTTTGSLPCKVFDPDEGVYGDMDTTATTDSLEENMIPPSLRSCSGSRPLMKVQDVPPSFDTTSSDTDPDSELTQDQ